MLSGNGAEQRVVDLVVIPLPGAGGGLDFRVMMVQHNGMATMTYRTTFAFDAATMRRLKNLAARWRVSQAEVVRRALTQAEHIPSTARPDPVTMLKELHAAGQGLSRKKAEAWLAEVRSDRKRWRPK